MAGQRPNKKPAKSIPAATSTSTSVSNAHSDHQPIKVNLYEPGALKHALDDVVRCVVLDAGYEEDLWISNVKTGTGLAAIAVALYSQFGPGKFPATWWPVFGCVVTYILLTLLLNWFCQVYEGEAFLVTSKATRGLRVASRMARFSEEYTLVIEQREDTSRSMSRSWDVSRYFHADGYLSEEAWRGEVEALLAQYEQAHVVQQGAGSVAGETQIVGGKGSGGSGNKKDD